MKIASRLVGKGGVGLVMFHLARLGIEFIETTVDSNQGDIWFRTTDGQMKVAEVKAAFNKQWPLRKSQTAADFFFFVEMRTGRVHVLSQPEMRNVLSRIRQSGQLLSITKTQIPASAEANWSALGGMQGMRGLPMPGTGAEKIATGRTRTVKRMLADGTLKEYTYPVRVRLPQVWKRQETPVS